jgi:hypothetical protein
MRAAIDAFLDTLKVKSTPNTLRAYTNVLDRTAEQVGPGRKLADVDDLEIGDARGSAPRRHPRRPSGGAGRVQGGARRDLAARRARILERARQAVDP